MKYDEVIDRIKSGNFAGEHGFDLQLLVDLIGTLSEMLRNGYTITQAQEPRVMTLEEIRQQLVYGSPYIIETNLSNDEPRLMYGLYSHQGTGGNFDFSFTDCRNHLYDVDYGKIWRCWTSRPTDEQREATPWIYSDDRS